MTDHFKHSLRIITGISIILLGVFLWYKHYVERVVFIPSAPGHRGLAADEREVVSYNENTHHVSVITSSGTLSMYARNPTVHVKKDGRVTVDRHLFGLEMRPLIGVGYSDTTRGMLGLMPLYWGPVDASISLGVSLDHQYVFAKPYVAVGYNCWSNLSVNAGVNPAGISQLDVIVFMSVRI